jgi:hypothetical protein
LFVAYDFVDRARAHPSRKRLAFRRRHECRLLPEFAGGGAGDAAR